MSRIITTEGGATVMELEIDGRTERRDIEVHGGDGFGHRPGISVRPVVSDHEILVESIDGRFHIFPGKR